MSKKIDILGKKFNRLTVIEKAEPYVYPNGKKGSSRYVCLCDCGKKKIVRACYISLGITISCGCARDESNVKRFTKHGQSHRQTTEYRSWRAMKERCYNRNTIGYQQWYGSKGVVVCERWKNSFENFFNDMGKKPSPKHSLDRINPYGDYEPSNCRWATPLEQTHNQRKRVKQINTL